MFLKQLYLKNFRIFNQRQFSFSPQANIFYGLNGVGKTSVLESIGYLGRGKSFRTAQSKKLIQCGKKTCTVALELEKMQCVHRMGVEIKQSETRRFQLNSQIIPGFSLLASIMPLIWINPSNIHLFLAAPSLRRQFVDWGVFHHFKDFYTYWRRYNKILQQRNIALKQKLSDKQLCCFDHDFIENALALDDRRKKYIDELRPIIFAGFKHFINLQFNAVEYNRGWPKKTSLKSLLEQSLQTDRRLGYTQFGPHRMDINLLIDEKHVQDFCSQGQHKLISYVFYLAQGQLFELAHHYSPIFLIDDLPSELDCHNIAAIAAILSRLHSQVFISGVAKEDFKSFCQYYKSELFHVKHDRCMYS